MNPFGEVEDWKPVEDAFDSLVKKAFPDDPLAKWHSGITLHADGRITVEYKAEVREV